MSDFDVIIVGGRPAGASLAARLGKLGRQVLVLERADLPSAPTVPSCPTLHMGTLALLDELELPEAAYADGAARFERFVLHFAATHPMYQATQKRLATELYSEPPRIVIRTLLRWMLTDPAYQARFVAFLGRQLDPAGWLTPRLVLGCVARGIGRDIARMFGARPALSGPA